MLSTTLTRAKAQLALALSYGFGSWSDLRGHILELKPWDSIEGKGGPERPALIIGDKIRFSTARPAPDDLDAFTFFWLTPAMEHFETRIMWSVLLPDGREHVIDNDLLGEVGSPTRSDYGLDHPTGFPRQFRGRSIVEAFRSENGKMRFRNAANYRFAFYKNDREGQINWQRPYLEIDAAVYWTSNGNLKSG